MRAQIQRHTTQGIEVRTTKGGHTLVGYGAKFGVTAKLPGFNETIKSGAFTRVLADPALDCRFLANHDASQIYGRTKAGTLRLSVDSTGLYYEVDLPDTQSANELWTAVKRGDITQSSFGFTVAEQEWGETRSDDGKLYVLRTITEVGSLLDVSCVTYPAYPGATCEARGKRSRMTDRIRRQFESVRELRSKGSNRLLWASPLAEFVHEVDHSAEISRRRSALLNLILS